MGLKLNVKNDNNHTIEFCCGKGEYVLEPDEKISIEIEDGDYMYFDTVR